MNRADYQECRIRYIHSSSVGVSRARNEGLAAATSDIVVMIDDDMLVPPSWFRLLIEALVHAGPESIVTGKVLPGGIELPGGFIPTVVERDDPQVYVGRVGTDVLPSCHMAMYRSVFQATDGFDVRLGPGTPFPAAEDNDYGYKLLEAGYKIVYLPQIFIHHRAWRAADVYYAVRWSYGRGKGAFYTKYAGHGNFHMLGRMLKDILIRLIRFPWRVLHRPRLAVGDLYYTMGILSGCVEWLFTYEIRITHPAILNIGGKDLS
jgi:GT2 family glycosyltransferase